MIQNNFVDKWRHMNVLVFDILTIPDIEGGQAIFDLKGLDDKSTAKAMKHIHQQKTGTDFLPLYLQKIIAISIVYRGMGDDMGKLVAVKSLGDENSSEAELLEALFIEIEGHEPQAISWNGSGFDLPVIMNRALKNKLSLPEYWKEQYHHTDLKFVVSGSNIKSSASLDHMAKLLGFPGKIGMDGSQVWDEYQAGNIRGIRNYCETDVLNTYLIFLQYQLLTGELTKEELEQEFALLRGVLELQSKDISKESNTGKNTHLGAFLKAW